MVRRMLATAATLVLFVSTGLGQTGLPEQTKEINRLIAEKWKENELQPSRPATDYEFIRRVTLDILGRIATPDEVRAYEADRSPDKRLRLVRKLLDKTHAEEYAAHWSSTWAVWLMSRSGNRTYHQQMQTWLEDQFARNTKYDKLVHELITAKGKTHGNGDNVNPAVNFVLHQLGETAKGEDEGKFEMVPITSRTTRLFLGLQTQCTQCHDHPFNPEWKQEHFWGVNVFFRQVDRSGTPTPAEGRNAMGPAVEVTLMDKDDLNKSGMVAFEKRNGLVKLTRASFLDTDHRKKPIDTSKSRREELARFIIEHDQFSKAIVNRMWGVFFGRGLNEQKVVDDFGEHNKVVHPELLDYLGKEFIAYKYDLKELIAWICMSDAYNLSCVANKTNVSEDKEAFFSRMLLKALSPEQMFETLLVATTPKDGKKPADIAAKAKQREDWLRRLVRNFGDDEGNEVDFNGTVVQALMLMNGKDVNDQVSSANGTVAAALKKHTNGGKVNTSAVVSELFLATLNRRPTQRELDDILAIQKGLTPKSAVMEKPNETKKPGSKSKKPMPVTPADKKEWAEMMKAQAELAAPNKFFEDVFWALLNTNEFILNH